jgi:hypothetical protein
MMSFRRTYRLCLYWFLLTIAFLAAALYNRHPFIFPDSVGYFHSGDTAFDVALDRLAFIGSHKDIRPLDPKSASEASAQKMSMEDETKDGISTSRSPYYGIGLAALDQLGGEWALPLAQVSITLLSLFLAARQFSLSVNLKLILVLFFIGTFAGAGIISSALMPDIFFGTTILALSVLIIRFEDLSIRERLYWIAIIVAGGLFHKADLATALFIATFGIIYRCFCHKFNLKLFLTLSTSLISVFVAHSFVNFMVEKVSGGPPIQTPFLLARMIGDGTAELYLKRHCAQTPYQLCHFLDQFPMTENDFLWGQPPAKSVMHATTVEKQRQIISESGAIMAGVLREYPLEQIERSTANSFRQFFEVGVTEYGIYASTEPERTQDMAATLTAYRSSRVVAGNMPLLALSRVMLITYILGFAALAGLIISPLKRLIPRSAWEMVGIIILGVCINAVISGVIAGVFDRYQGRVSWLVPLAAFFVLLKALETSRQGVSGRPLEQPAQALHALATVASSTTSAPVID